MKIFTTLLIPFLFLFILQWSSCKKDNDPTLPPITSEGKNTFGCLVNGKVWLPNSKLLNVLPVLADYTSGNFLSFRAASEDSGFLFVIDSPISVNHNYDLSDTANVKAYYEKGISSIICTYESYNVIKGSLILSKFSITNRIVSGVFEFITYKVDCGDTIKVTDGRFDIGEIML